MLEALTAAFQTPGLWLLALGAFMAGLVRGFAGFGSAMIYLPVAAQVLTPIEAITTLLVKELFGPLIQVPRAMRDGHPADVIRLSIGAMIGVPIGVWVLGQIAPEIFRWSVSTIALLIVTALITGFRYRGVLTKPLIYATGALGGFLGGSAGLPGPPIILLYMASTLPVAAIRANNTLYLLLADVLMIAVFWMNGYLAPTTLILGALIIVPYTAGIWAGSSMFRPEAAARYRAAAYVIIAGSALLGLPLWD